MSLTAQNLAVEIKRQANLFLHLKEVVSNQRWDNPLTPSPEKALSDYLVAAMKEAGWPPGAPYCAAFAEAMVVLALRNLGADTALVNRFRGLMTPHCVTSFNNFNRLNLIESKPSSGAIWLARHGNTDSGHAGLVTSDYAYSSTRMATIEGNTSAEFITDDKERQGDGIYARTRTVQNGKLKTLGFISPVSVLSLVESSSNRIVLPDKPIDLVPLAAFVKSKGGTYVLKEGSFFVRGNRVASAKYNAAKETTYASVSELEDLLDD
jgi:hypothetical protein